MVQKSKQSTISVPANLAPKEATATSVNTPLLIPITTTAQAYQQNEMTLETLLSDGLNGTTNE